MAKIGDYVHYYWRNYRYYGTNKPNKQPSMTLQESHNLQKDLVNSQLSKVIEGGLNKQELNQLEQTLNYMTGKQVGGKDPSEDSNIKNLQQALKEVMEEDYKNKLGKINWSKWDVEGLGLKLKKGEEQTVKSMKKISIEDNILFSTIERKVGILLSLQKQLNEKAANKEGTSTYTLNSLINKIDAEFERLKQLEGFGQRGRKKILVSNKKNRSPLYINNTTLVDDINRVCALLANNTGSLANQKGDLFEYGIAATKAFLANAGVEELKEEMRKNQKGGDSSYTITDFGNFMSGVNAKSLGLTVSENSEGGRYYFSTRASQGKLDVFLDWDSKPVRISAKNKALYPGSHDIGLVSGTPLTYLIQDSNPVFINHYLNLAVNHIEEVESERTKSLNIIKETIKQTLLLKALTGNTFGRFSQRVNVFVINDNRTNNGGVQVFGVDELIKKTMMNTDRYLSILGGKTDIVKLRFANEFSPISPYDRINTLIRQVYNTKIFVGLRSSLFAVDKK